MQAAGCSKIKYASSIRGSPLFSFYRQDMMLGDRFDDHESSRTSMAEDWEFLVTDFTDDDIVDASRPSDTAIANEYSGTHDDAQSFVAFGAQTDCPLTLDAIDEYLWQQSIEDLRTVGPIVPRDVQNLATDTSALPATTLEDRTNDPAWMDVLSFPDIATTAFGSLDSLNMDPDLLLGQDLAEAYMASVTGQYHQFLSVPEDANISIPTMPTEVNHRIDEQSLVSPAARVPGYTLPTLHAVQDNSVAVYSRKRRNPSSSREQLSTSKTIPGTASFQLSLPRSCGVQPKSRTRGSLSAASKDNAKRVRRSGGACLRCRIQKIPVCVYGDQKMSYH